MIDIKIQCSVLRLDLLKICVLCQVYYLYNDRYRIINPIALRKAKIVYNFGLSECNKVYIIGCAGEYFFTFMKQ